MVANTRRPRVESPERWRAALERAIAGNVQVRQLRSSGQWIATSSSDPNTAHELDVTGNVVHGCTCPAAEHGDPVCAHRAAFWHLVGALTLPEAAPVAEPAPVVEPETITCPKCLGDGFIRVFYSTRHTDWWPGSCFSCSGTGVVTSHEDVLAA